MTLSVLLTGCGGAEQRVEPVSWLATSEYGMVASDNVYASQAGAHLLRQGGNAVDAAVATSFALGVVRPYSTGLGGGGFMILRLAATGEVVALDFRESAPAAATANMFVDAEVADGPRPSEVGGLAVAVPGLLMGQVNLLRSYGSQIPSPDDAGAAFPGLSRVLEPAIRLADDGYVVDQHYVNACEDVAKTFAKHPALRLRARYVWRTHVRGGSPRDVGEILRQPALARALRTIRDQGPAAFYGGDIGASLVRSVRRDGGIITLDDLRDYELRERLPIVTSYRDMQVISFPPPSSGGVALAEALNILEHVDIAHLHTTDPGLAAHRTVESLKHAFADRARWLGDPDFVSIPVDTLISKEYAADLANRVQSDRVAPIETYGGNAGTPSDRQATPPDDRGTSHFCVVDRIGNCVVWTETINTTFGSLLSVDEYGIVLNNEMDDFSARPGEPNAFGLVQSAANAVAPGKRPLSSMTPTIVTRHGVPALLVGASGGPRIISSVLQTLLHFTEYEMPLNEAVRTTRLHHQWRPNVVYFDRPADADITDALRRRGHEIADERRGAVVQAIAIHDGTFVGVSDPRKGGAPASP